MSSPSAGPSPAVPNCEGHRHRGDVKASVLVVEPYFGGSHRQWAEGYRDHSGHDVALLTLPARWWKWRMRGAAATLAEQVEGHVARHGRPDVVLVSDMIDLAAFRGFALRSLGDVPVALYFHETQLTYPDAPGIDPDLSYAFINWNGALAADAVAFNSEYHRRVFFAEIPRLLRHFPDHTHVHRIPEVAAKSVVLPVGVDLAWADGTERPSSGPPVVLWNHRWEYDKGPAEFFAALEELAGRGVEFRVAVAGENRRRVPEEFERARRVLADRVVWWGFAERAHYLDLLRRADVVVSTARQEFFGVAIVEAVAAGACPVLPDRLSYPELLPAELHPTSLYPDGGLVDRTRELMADPGRRGETARRAAAAMRRFDWSEVAPRYDEWLWHLSGGSGRRA